MWTAISLWLIVGGGALAYVAWAAAQVGGGAPVWPFVAGLPLVYFALILVNTSAFFALAWLYRAQRPTHAQIDGRRTARMVWDEYRTLAGSAPRMMLYKLLMTDPAPAPAELPVLLVHGVLCNAGVWTRMKRHLEAEGLGPVYALSYGPPLASIDLFADQVAAKIDAILAATGAAQVVIVGHSMGGLVARAYVRRHGGQRIRCIITIGTPHRGSVLAYMFPGVSLSQLRPRSPWLAALDTPAAADLPPIVSLWSWHDTMVAPQTSSDLEGAQNFALSGVGHNALLADPQVMQRVAAEIEAATAGGR